MGQPAPPAGGNTRQVTDLLLQLRDGDTEAMDRLFSLVYEELRRIAHRQLQLDGLGTPWARPAWFTRPTCEWWIRRGSSGATGLSSSAPRRGRCGGSGGLRPSEPRGTARGRGAPITLDDDLPAAERGELVLALDEALERLAGFDRRLSQVVECRYFGGLTEEETADVLGVTRRTVQRDWVKARAWLLLEMNG